MSELVVVGFDNELKADEVLHKLGQMQQKHLVDLEDAVVVIKNQQGKIKIKQADDLITSGLIGGGFWGSFIGLLFLHPLLGVTVGMASGALSGALTDIGIDDNFIKELSQTLEPGTSALFLLIRKAIPDRVVAELRPHGGKLLQTSLSQINEASLKTALEQAQTQAVS